MTPVQYELYFIDWRATNTVDISEAVLDLMKKVHPFHVVLDPTKTVEGFILSKVDWVTLSTFRTDVGKCRSNLAIQGIMINYARCVCGSPTQTMQHIFKEWILTKYVIPYQVTLLAAIDSFKDSHVLKCTSLLNKLGLLCIVNRLILEWHVLCRSHFY